MQTVGELFSCEACLIGDVVRILHEYSVVELVFDNPGRKIRRSGEWTFQFLAQRVCDNQMWFVGSTVMKVFWTGPEF